MLSISPTPALAITGTSQAKSSASFVGEQPALEASARINTTDMSAIARKAGTSSRSAEANETHSDRNASCDAGSLDQFPSIIGKKQKLGVWARRQKLREESHHLPKQIVRPKAPQIEQDKIVVA